MNNINESQQAFYFGKNLNESSIPNKLDFSKLKKIIPIIDNFLKKHKQFEVFGCADGDRLINDNLEYALEDFSDYGNLKDPQIVIRCTSDIKKFNKELNQLFISLSSLIDQKLEITKYNTCLIRLPFIKSSEIQESKSGKGGIEQIKYLCELIDRGFNVPKNFRLIDLFNKCPEIKKDAEEWENENNLKITTINQPYKLISKWPSRSSITRTPQIKIPIKYKYSNERKEIPSYLAIATYNTSIDSLKYLTKIITSEVIKNHNLDFMRDFADPFAKEGIGLRYLEMVKWMRKNINELSGMNIKQIIIKFLTENYPLEYGEKSIKKIGSDFDDKHNLYTEYSFLKDKIIIPFKKNFTCNDIDLIKDLIEHPFRRDSNDIKFDHICEIFVIK